MDNAQKAIMIGVGLFITIIIIAAVMLITGMGQNLLNKGQAQVSGISESLMNDLTQQYNGKTFSGSQVRSAAVQLINRDEAGITVKIQNTTGKADTYISGTATTSQINTKLSGQDSVKYKGSVSTANGSVTVTFTAVGATTEQNKSQE